MNHPRPDRVRITFARGASQRPTISFVSESKFAIYFSEQDEKDSACRHLAQCGRILDEIQERGWADVQTTEDCRWYESFREQLELL